MAYILNIETSTNNCSVSLSFEGRIFALREDYSNDYSHSERLHVYIDQVMEEAKIKRSQLEAIAVSKGPGSYTGLRIGVSAAKGLCYALDKPLISISTLEALAHQARTDDGLIIPMLDARRMEVYSAVFDQRYRQVREIEAEIITPSSFEAYLSNGKVCFIGNGVEKSMDIITHPNAVFIKDKLPSSNDMGLLSFKKYLGKQFEDVAYFEPFYLKDFISLGART